MIVPRRLQVLPDLNVKSSYKRCYGEWTGIPQSRPPPPDTLEEIFGRLLWLEFWAQRKRISYITMAFSNCIPVFEDILYPRHHKASSTDYFLLLRWPRPWMEVKICDRSMKNCCGPFSLTCSALKCRRYIEQNFRLMKHWSLTVRLIWTLFWCFDVSNNWTSHAVEMNVMSLSWF